MQPLDTPSSDDKEKQTASVVKAMIALDQNIYLGTISKQEKARRRARNKKAKASRKANRGK